MIARRSIIAAYQGVQMLCVGDLVQTAMEETRERPRAVSKLARLASIPFAA